MLKIIIVLCVFFIFMVDCLEDIPKADEIRKIVQERRYAIEMEQQQMIEAVENRKQQLDEIAQRKKEELARERELIKQTIVQNTLEFCDKHHEAGFETIRLMVSEMKASDDMEIIFSEIPRNIAFCVMDALMSLSYCVRYIPEHQQFIIDLNKSADESRIEMKHSELCGDTITYAINCSQQREDCMMFQLEFSRCVEDDDDEFDASCFNAPQYLGMKEIYRQHPDFVCA